MALQPDLPPDVQFSTAIWFRPELNLEDQRTFNHCMDAIGLAHLNCEVGHFVRFLQTDNNTIHCPDVDRMAHFEIPFDETLQDGVRYHAIFCDRFLFEHCRRIVSTQGLTITLNGRAQQCNIEFHFLSPFIMVDRLIQTIDNHQIVATAHDQAIATLQHRNQALTILTGNLTQELDALRTLLTATIRDLGLEHIRRRPRTHPDDVNAANQM